MTTGFDSRELMTGKDGRLYLRISEFIVLLAEVNTYSITMNIETKEYRPIGSLVVQRVPEHVSYDLTFTEMVVRDGIFMKPLLEEMKKGNIPEYSFQSAAVKPDGTEQRLMFKNAIPNGAFNIQTLVPGEVIEREMSFALNDVPEFISALKSNYLENLDPRALEKIVQSGLVRDPEE